MVLGHVTPIKFLNWMFCRKCKAWRRCVILEVVSTKLFDEPVRLFTYDVGHSLETFFIGISNRGSSISSEEHLQVDFQNDDKLFDRYHLNLLS